MKQLFVTYYRPDEPEGGMKEAVSPPAVEEILEPTVEVDTPAEGAIPATPKGEVDMAYRLGRLETRLVETEERLNRWGEQLAAFEAATIAAVEEEAKEIEKQSEVIDAVAEEVLPEDDEAAVAHNPDHAEAKCGWWERLMGGCK